MAYQDTVIQLNEYRKKIYDIRAEMRELQKQIEPQKVEDYAFESPDGKVRLSELFDGKENLIIIHNMGIQCNYCTLWADGYNGIYPQLSLRASFYLSSPNSVETQQQFAKDRGWRFPMISHKSNSFAKDMGYHNDEGYHPGISTFILVDGKPHRISDTQLGPYDDFCSLWHMYDMCPSLAGDWNYEAQN